MKQLLCLFAFAFITIQAFADVRLPKLFGNSMVLQRDKPITIWGWADRGEKVTVSFHEQTKSAKTAKDGRWSVELAPEKAGGPFDFKVKGKNEINVSDVLVGEVWVCSGQSNMEMPIGAWGFINDYEKVIQQANYPTIRQFAVPKNTAATPQEDLTGGDWKLCTPENAAEFSAVAYFFARELQERLHVPVGLINTTWGGTHVETWTSRQAFENDPYYKSMIGQFGQSGIDEITNKRKTAVAELIARYPHSGNIAEWSRKDFDDQGWNTMKVPGLWEEQGLPDVDGEVWLRKTINLEESDVKSEAVLRLGTIDDDDSTFINGELVGASTGYNVSRKYMVRSGLLQAGTNVITVKVTDNAGGGGIYGDAAAISLDLGGHSTVLAGDWKYNVESIRPVNTLIGPNSFPTLLFNAMINPLIPVSMRGVIWYQGEANGDRSYEYRRSFPLMINDWRGRWKQGDFPFYFVQLSSWNAAGGNSLKGSGWAELREAQLMTLKLPNTGMAVTTDIGNATDIHPKNKVDVGKRLAAIAFANTYSMGGEYSGPVYQRHEITGSKITVHFTHAGTGLMTKDKYGYVRGFEVAGADKVFHYAKATIVNDQVVVECDAVSNPVALRYGWMDDAGEINLFNREGFPASPFRTDDWPGITANAKYSIN